MSFRFAKKAICLNFRYDFFREIMIAFLREKNYHLRSFLTYYHSHHARTFSRLPLAFDNWKFSDTIRRGIDKMQPELPYTLEARGAQAVCPSAHAFPDIKLGINRRQESSIGKYYENSFVSIVNETRYFSYCPNVSEKTINSFFYFRPAILTAPPGSLEYLQTLGFKTFHEYWDESYDREMDHAQRFERIFSLLDKIFSLSQQKLEELLWEMQPILYHNRYRLLDFVDDQRNFIKKEQ